MPRTRIARLVLAAAFALAGFSAPASAQPDIAGTRLINEPNGFPPACTAPCFTVEKAFEVYLDGNPSAPGVCAAGENTYVYTITHLGGTGPFVPALTKYEISVVNAGVNVTSAGFIPGPLDPSATTIDGAFDVITWDFLAPTIASGQTSSQLFLCSPLGPGPVTENMVSVDGQANLDAPSTCVGPVEAACDLEIDKTCCIPKPALPDLGQCEGDLVSLQMEYTADKCSASNNEQGKAFKCFGKKSPGSPADITFPWYDDETQASPDTDVVVGDIVNFTSIDGTLRKKTVITTQGSWWQKQTVKIDTSCKRAINCDDQFGAYKVVGFESTIGGVVDCSAPPPPPTCDTPDDPPGTPCDAKLVDMVLEYVGQDCQEPLPNPQNGEAFCSGDATGATDVGIVYTGKFPFATQVSPASNVNDGDLVRVTSTWFGGLFPNVEFLVTDDSGVLQEVGWHVSCSQPLALGDQFGSFKLVEFTTKAGTNVALGDGGDGTFDACEVPLAPPKPHCTSDLQELTLVYIGDLLGEGCTVSNSQSGFGTCSGVDDPGDPVDVVMASGLTAVPSTDIGFGDLVVITADDEGDLPGLTNLDVTGAGGSQSLQIKTSCWKPLSLGDRFGSFVVFGMDREDDGPIALGGEVLYQYKVTNPNASTVDNVTVTDSELGEIVSGVSIPAGGMDTFTAQATLFSTTTNIATVTGDVGGSACEAAIDEVTVDVKVPPSGSFSCACYQALSQITLIWDGTDTVNVKVWDGPVASTQIATLTNVAPGDEVTVAGFTQENSTWEIFKSGTTQKLGESEFDLSCRDRDMNGVQDCGKNAGDGKNDDPLLINDWLIEGMVDDDETLVCTPEVPELPDDDCGLGPELALLLPGLMWLSRRRLLKKA